MNNHLMAKNGKDEKKEKGSKEKVFFLKNIELGLIEVGFYLSNLRKKFESSSFEEFVEV